MIKFNNKTLALSILFYWIANVLMHMEFSRWVTTPFILPFSESHLKVKLVDFSMSASIIFIVIAASLLIKYYKKINRKVFLIRHLFFWLVGMFAINIILLTTPVEYIHYLQYGFLGWLLAIWIEPKQGNLSLIVFLIFSAFCGVVDELLQYLSITAQYSFHLDFNDFVLNFWATTLGLILYLGFNLKSQKKTFDNKQLIKLTIFPAMALIIFLILPLTSWVELSPVSTIQPGGIDCTNQCVLYLERNAGMMGSWKNKFIGGQYYILLWWQTIVIMMAIIAYSFILNRSVNSGALLRWK